MQSIGIYDYSYNSFNLSITTSSGDRIDLTLYDEKSSSSIYGKNGTSETSTLSLSHNYGYSFHYKGDGIDENDKREIDKALKIIKPMLESYFSNIKNGGEISNHDIANTSFDIISKLPNTEDQNGQNYIKGNTLKMVDSILKRSENQNKNMLNYAKKLFDDLLYQMDGFKLYT